MTSLLHIRVSARADASLSRQVGDLLVAELQRSAGPLDVVTRDLGRQPPAHPDHAFVHASLMPEADRTAEHHRALAFSKALVDELKAADYVVIDTPMHNFTVPSALKAWIDLIVRPRVTFGFGPDGKIGLLDDRPVRIVVACGGRFGEQHQADFFSPYLRYVFATIGIRDVDIHRLEALGRGQESQRAAVDAGQAWARSAFTGARRPHE